ncbi:hypothetical protein BpHYR1_011105 [Brachionus plicatilis]|uniref:Uncharacterized protein n=1 Tax=Brachionus plicatilis TaxID=10195 RepID=A0A3M7RWP9_BRAPC|nr:hypothetical protein BpHYR1_011105 [Brachionus plicatilis]
MILESPFTNYFENLLEENNYEGLERSEKNHYYYPNFFEIIKKQLHIVPFWSGLLLNHYEIIK